MADAAKRLGEMELIARIAGARRFRNTGVRVGIGDDAAVVKVRAGEDILVTTDLLLEGRHFRRDWHSAESAGHRCLARGLSDVAAMGGRPVAAFLSLALPKDFELEWVDDFMAGFGALAERFGVELAGGDTAQAAGEEIVADVMVLGGVEREQAMLRTGAQVGDFLYVSGSLGGAAVELAALAAGAECPAGARAGHPASFPEPRLKVGATLLRKRLATSCMDLSDGLSIDLRRLCEASGVGAEVLGADLPIARGATLAQAVDGGEDYELLFTARDWVRMPAELAGVAVTRIGTMTKGGTVELLSRHGIRREMEVGGWEHFRG